MNGLAELQAGKAGEYLVCADLTLQGYTAFLSAQGLPYDVIAEVDGRLLKIQVKSMQCPSKSREGIPLYAVNPMQKGKRGKRKYRADEVDIFAFVALDTKIIGYLARKDCKTCMQFRVESYRGKYKSDLFIEKCCQAVKLFIEGKDFVEISKSLGISKSQASKYIKRGAETKGKYLSEMLLADALDRL